jgi:hypothetical protein
MVTSVIFLIIGSCFIINNNNAYDTWLEQVKEQIDSLECENLQEAYEIYKQNFIKEKFLFECVDTREAWWK